MLHPLFSTVLQRPDLVIDHVSAYAALARQEAGQAGSELLTRVVAWVAFGILALVFLIFAGIAFMLGFSSNQFHWVYVLVPGSVLVLMLVAFVIARKPLQSERFPELKAQLDKDARTLRAVA